MEIERTDEEKVEALKDWFKKNGSAIVFGLAIGLAAIGGYRFWQDYTTGQRQKASLAYTTFENELIKDDAVKVFALGEKLVEQYPATPYASLAALGMARMSVENNSLDAAEVHLNWVINNGKERGLVYTAKLRLARVLAAEKKYQQALSLLGNVDGQAYASLYQEATGDIFLAKGDKKQAREAYQKALATVSTDDQRRVLLDMKINDLPNESIGQVSN